MFILSVCWEGLEEMTLQQQEAHLISRPISSKYNSPVKGIKALWKIADSRAWTARIPSEPELSYARK